MYVFAHFEVVGYGIGGGYLCRDIFAWFKTMRSKQNLASPLGIQKKNWG